MEQTKILFKGKRKKKSVNEIVFMVTLMAIPVLHFCVFWLFINIDSILLSFKKFNMMEGMWEWAGLANYRALWTEFNKPGSVLPRAISQFVLGLFMERFRHFANLSFLRVYAV